MTIDDSLGEWEWQYFPTLTVSSLCFFQVLHNLSMWCARTKALTYDQAKADSHRAKKDIKLVK